MAVPVTQDVYGVLASMRDYFANSRDVARGQAAAATREADLNEQRVTLMQGVLDDLTVTDPPAVSPTVTG